jgi:hypothetical protein
VGSPSELFALIQEIGAGNRTAVLSSLTERPELLAAGLGRDEEFFFAAHRAQVYAGDTALHAAAFAYRTDLVADLTARGADVRARNRRGAEPLHSATIGGPGPAGWDPDAQVAVIRALVAAGAEPNAKAMGGVTPLHRAVRNRCSAAVATLLALGANPRLKNDNGSTAMDLVQWTTGRPGSGSPEAKAEQQRIAELLG